MRRARRVLLGGAAAGVMVACGGTSASFGGPIPGEVREGTWGGKNAALIVTAATAHVHIDCTLGDFDAPIVLDARGRFNVPGSYVLRAYPVQVGPPLPAQFSGVVEGNRLILSVAVQDTVEDALVALGPVTLSYGREPEMQMCPICENLGEVGGARQAMRRR